MEKDLPLYQGTVVTDLVHIEPALVWQIMFDVECQYMDPSQKTVLEVKNERMEMKSKSTIWSCKDATRDEMNTWLNNHGYAMAVPAPEVVADAQ